jgi:PAS domain S-box-containing protein
MSPHRLLRQELSLNHFLNSARIGILFISKDGLIESPNQACSLLSGFTIEELEGLPFTELLSQESKEIYLERFEAFTREENVAESEVIELQLLSKRKNITPVEFSINNTLIESNQLYIAILNNILKRRQLENKVKEQSIHNKEVENALKKEQELSTLKSRFVTIASHEFRTPLAGVLSSVNLVQRYLDAEAAAGLELQHKQKIENHFSKIKESVGNLTQILNEFLSLGKLEEGKVTCQWEKLELTDLVNDTITELKKLCKPRQRILIENSTKRKEFILDYNMLRNIINNFITNAIKYSDPGNKILLSLKDTESHLLIEVKDEGKGIPKEEQAELFSRFFRASNVSNIQGTGLGLNIVKRYVNMMNGTISFKSELNKGTTFSVQIPLRDEI